MLMSCKLESKLENLKIATKNEVSGKGLKFRPIRSRGKSLSRWVRNRDSRRLPRQIAIFGICRDISRQYTGWPKSNVPKVRAYCSASDHLIRKIISGVCRDIQWFEEYLKIIEIDDHFFE